MKKLQGKSALLTLLMVGFVALFSVGCGDDRDDFIVTNNNAATGSLLFRFQQAAAAQAVDTVPSGTQTLRFDFFSSTVPATNSLLFTETRAFATQVTFNNVPATTRSVLVTAFGANNLPLATLGSQVLVNVGQTTTVDLADAQPVSAASISVVPEIILLTVNDTEQVVTSATFSNTSVATVPNNLASYSLSPNNGVASVSSTGLVTGLNAGGSTTLTTSFSFGGQTRTDTSSVRVVAFDAFTDGPTTVVQGSSITPAYFAEFTNFDGTFLNVTSNVTYSLSGAPAGVTINPNTGVISATSTAGTGSFGVVLTWVDGRPSTNPLATGATFQDTLEFTSVNQAQ